MDEIPLPGDLYNLIQTSLAFSDPIKKYDYLKILLKNSLKNNVIINENLLKQMNFTKNEIEILKNKKL
ncbi:hypothetical protein [Mesomycoplasma neurolyticum]|uniref:ATPase, AAA family n=1 Tax=Mesomycoplasma neurolyticum TaxID=2120 RepID=A0A449A5A6_9BACT|nr:hypothetical protein [Mesomycoplasma neurolyticum]VEU59333.1 ATPase, AAA family [Mesomycoplasma neurolyticum]